MQWKRIASAAIAVLTMLTLCGGIASATQPAAKVKAGSQWTVIVVAQGATCEVVSFKDGAKFTADLDRDKGTYDTSGKSLSMAWTKGADAGATFSGTYVKQTIDGPEYQGTFGGTLAGYSGGLIEGAQAGC